MIAAGGLIEHLRGIELGLTRIILELSRKLRGRS
jgi:hypothetical protein